MDLFTNIRILCYYFQKSIGEVLWMWRCEPKSQSWEFFGQNLKESVKPQSFFVPKFVILFKALSILVFRELFEGEIQVAVHILA